METRHMSDLRDKFHGFYMACFELYLAYSSLFESLARIATGEADDAETYTVQRDLFGDSPITVIVRKP